MRRYAIAALLLLASVTTSYAGTISLGWDAVNHPGLAGYRVYYGTVPNTYGNNVNVGLATAATLSGLSDCTTYYSAVKAYDDEGLESATYSNVISGWARPVVTAVTPSQIVIGSQTQLTIDGVNFQSGAVVRLSNQSITVGTATVTSCSRLTVSVTVPASVPVGPLTVRVVNPDQVYGEAAGLLAVVADGSAPTITGVTAGAIGPTRATITWTTNEPANGRVLYRRQGETGYQTTSVDPVLTTAHSRIIEGLRPGTTYQFHVESADAAGNLASSGADAVLLTQTSSFKYLRLEAESGTLIAPVVRKNGSGVFNGSWVEVPAGQVGTPAAPAGESRIGFQVPYAGDWRIWILMRGTDPTGAAWFEGVDGAALVSVVLSAQNTWQWLPGRTYTLAAGLHTLRLGGRRGEARADRVIVTDDPTFTPTEQPVDDFTAPGPVTGLGAAPGDGTNRLSWTNPLDPGSLTVVVRYRSDGVLPLGPADGFPVAEVVVTPGGVTTVDHNGLTNGTTYSYAVFVMDFAGNVSTAATVTATPLGTPPPTVANVHRTDVLP